MKLRVATATLVALSLLDGAHAVSHSQLGGRLHDAAYHRAAKARLRSTATAHHRHQRHAISHRGVAALQRAAPAPAPAPASLGAAAPGAAVSPQGLAPFDGSTANESNWTSPGSEVVPVPFLHGDPLCPCIGFDNIDGETLVQFDDVQVPYPADLGARCAAWDNGRHPTACQDALQQPGKGKGWCMQPWCFVDACNCKLPVLPKVSTYLPEATYVGKPLYVSYSTCGAADPWADELPKVGMPECRCIGFAGQDGTTEVMIKGSPVSFPAEIGGSCQAWDKDVHPECKVDPGGSPPPPWCGQSWCYVDPCSCKLETPPKVSAYLPDSTFQGKPVYYSYATCGSQDFWTEANHKTACVNQRTETSCEELGHCAWTSTGECLGKELVEVCGNPYHPGIDDIFPGEKSAAAGRAGISTVMTFVFMLLAMKAR